MADKDINVNEETQVILDEIPPENKRTRLSFVLRTKCSKIKRCNLLFKTKIHTHGPVSDSSSNNNYCG